MPAGQGQIISTTATNRASRGYDDRWALSNDVEFSKTDNQFYWEHGLLPRVTLIGTTAFQDVDFTSRDGRKSVTGFGTSSLGARYQIYQKGRFVGSLQGAYILAGAGENIADADLGRGGNGFEIRALAGRSFQLFKREGFIDVQSAWIIRPGDSPDTFKDDLTIGWSVDKKTQIIGQGFYSRTNAQVLDFDRILPNESFKLQASIVRKRSETRSVQFGVFRSVAGRNIVQESGVYAAVWRRY